LHWRVQSTPEGPWDKSCDKPAQSLTRPNPRAGLTLAVPDNMARILIVFENNDADSERLKAVLREAGLTSENANSITAGCEAARSGRFQVVFSPPLMADGSWTRLLDVANHCGFSLEVILLARTFNLNQWGEALHAGAFDVLDVLCDLPKAAEAAKRALRANRPRALAAASRARVG